MSIRIDNVLVAPIVTEKSVGMEGKYTFKVHSEATKPQVMEAVKKFYGVDVVRVNVVNLGGKTRAYGRGQIMTKRAPFKKAIVTLKGGATLNFNDFK